MMPVSAVCICVLVNRYMTTEKVAEEVMAEGRPFRMRRVFDFSIRFLCPVFVLIILLSSVASVLGLIQM